MRDADDTSQMNRAGAWRVKNFDLSDVGVSTPTGAELGMHGFGLCYLARGSHPGGLLELDVGGEVKTFGPGDSFKGEFSNLRFVRAAGSAQTGPISFLVLTQPGVDFVEAARLQIRNLQQLAGAFAERDTGIPTATVSVPVNKLPTANDYTAAAMLDVAGYRFIELLMSPLDGPGNSLDNVDLVVTPWAHAGYSTTAGGRIYWAAQNDQARDFPATVGAFFIDAVFEVRGRARMAFSFSGDASIDHVGFVARGVL